MATTPPPLSTTAPPTPPRVAPAVAAYPPRSTPPAPARSVSQHPPTTPPRADESGADTVAAVRGPTSAAESAAAAEMYPAADISTGQQQAATPSREDSPDFTYRHQYGPDGADNFQGPVAAGPAEYLFGVLALPNREQQHFHAPGHLLLPLGGSALSTTGLGVVVGRACDGAYLSRTVKRRAMRCLCFACRNALTVGSEHPKFPPWCSCPRASPLTVLISPNENGVSERVTREGRQERLDQKRAHNLERRRQFPLRWERRLSWPDASGNRNEYWLNVNLPQEPAWWEPQRLGPLPLPRRHLRSENLLWPLLRPRPTAPFTLAAVRDPPCDPPCPSSVCVLLTIDRGPSPAQVPPALPLFHSFCFFQRPWTRPCLRTCPNDKAKLIKTAST